MSNLFYDDEILERFHHDVRSGCADGDTSISDEVSFIKENYPEDSQKLTLKFDEETDTTSASYNGVRLFSVHGDTILDHQTGADIEASASGFRVENSGILTERGIQKHIAEDYVAFKKDFAQAYAQGLRERASINHMMSELNEAVQIAYSDVHIGPYDGSVTVLAGDKEGEFTIEAPKATEIKSLESFISKNGEQKEIEPNSLSGDMAIRVANLKGLKGDERVAFLLNTLDAQAFKASDPYFQPVLDDIKEQMIARGKGEYTEECGFHGDGSIDVTFIESECRMDACRFFGSEVGDNVYQDSILNYENFFTEKGMEDVLKTRKMSIREGLVIQNTLSAEDAVKVADEREYSGGYRAQWLAQVTADSDPIKPVFQYADIAYSSGDDMAIADPVTVSFTPDAVLIREKNDADVHIVADTLDELMTADAIKELRVAHNEAKEETNSIRMK